MIGQRERIDTASGESRVRDGKMLEAEVQSVPLVKAHQGERDVEGQSSHSHRVQCPRCTATLWRRQELQTGHPVPFTCLSCQLRFWA